MTGVFKLCQKTALEMRFASLKLAETNVLKAPQRVVL